jgi:hypothetical protein
MRNEITLTLVVLIVALATAFHYETMVPSFEIYQPLEIELRTPDVLIFDAKLIRAGGRSVHDRVVDVLIKRMESQSILYLWYGFDSELCSDAVYIDVILPTPMDWSGYDELRLSVYGDGSGNTFQIWFYDAMTERWWGIGCLALNWCGWKRWEFYIHPTYSRRAVRVLRFLLLHEFHSPTNETWEFRITNPIFVENLKGCLNIRYDAYVRGDIIEVVVLNDGCLRLSYNFSAPYSRAVYIDRRFLVDQDWARYRVFEAEVMGDGSNNLLQFWFFDSQRNRWIGIGSVTLDWVGWRHLRMYLPKGPRSSVDIFRVMIVDHLGEGSRETSMPPSVRNWGTISIRRALIRDVAHIPTIVQAAIVAVYIIALLAIRHWLKTVWNPFLTCATMMASAASLLALGYVELAENLMTMSSMILFCGFFTIIINFPR